AISLSWSVIHEYDVHHRDLHSFPTRRSSDLKVITWEGACEVHERFTAEEIRDYRAAHPGIVVLAHPECPPEVVAEADFAGSTARSEEHTSELQSRGHLVCRLLLEKKKNTVVS